MTVPVALVVAGALFVWFRRLERAGRGLTVVTVVLGLTLAEALVYQGQNDIPASLIHPEFRGLSFRLVDLVIPVALAARFMNRTRGGAVNTSVLLWLAVGVWLAGAGLLGVYDGNSLKLVGYHGKEIIYVVGAVVLAAGVPLREYLAPGRLERFLTWTSAAALAVILIDLSGIRVSVGLPLLPLEGFGLMGTDAATIFTSLGIVALALGLVGERRRGRLLVLALPLLAAPVLADQRAAFVALAASLGVVALVTTFSRRRVNVSGMQIGFAALTVTGLLLLFTMGPILTGGDVKLPFQDRLTTTFTSYEEVLTTQDRLNQWHAVLPLIGERPLLGWGLGKEYVYYNVGYTRFDKLHVLHNIFGDLVLRSGFAGLALFLLALGTTGVAVARGWSWHESDRAAALALAAGAVITGLVAKGMVESIFEQYRLAVVFGLGVGLMISAGLPAQARAALRSHPQRSPRISKDRISPRTPARL